MLWLVKTTQYNQYCTKSQLRNRCDMKASRGGDWELLAGVGLLGAPVKNTRISDRTPATYESSSSHVPEPRAATSSALITPACRSAAADRLPPRLLGAMVRRPTCKSHPCRRCRLHHQWRLGYNIVAAPIEVQVPACTAVRTVGTLAGTVPVTYARSVARPVTRTGTQRPGAPSEHTHTRIHAHRRVLRHTIHTRI